MVRDDDCSQTSDEDVVDLPPPAAPGARASTPSPALRSRDEEVGVRAGHVQLNGRLTVPGGAPGIVVFAHGSGSSRHSPRNRAVAGALNAAGLGTLLFDLLALDEEAHRSDVFDVDLLARRLRGVTAWLRSHDDLRALPIGWFGASTGAAAALWAAAEPGADIAAVVSRGGRPDLAGPRLGLVRAPTLLIVGGADDVGLRLNRRARTRLRCTSDLVVVPGAGHLFEEPGALEQVAQLTERWCSAHFPPARPAGA